MTNLELYVEKLIETKTVEHIAISVGKGDAVLFETYRSGGKKIDDKTLFDMASVTKILSVTPIALIALDNKLISLEEKVSDFFDFNIIDDYKNLKIINLLTHTMGIGHEDLTKENVTYDNAAEYILNIPAEIPVGSDVKNSCPAFILLGVILEKVYGKQLDVLAENMVFSPLKMQSTRYKPEERNNIVNFNLSEDNRGLVNDYNARYLGGVAGNAGVFSNMTDMKKFAKMLSETGGSIIPDRIFDIARKNHTQGMSEARGLGFLYVDEEYKQTGGCFSIGSIGHCGHTGQSVFVDLKTGLYVIIMSDATISTIKKYGHERYELVEKMREDIHNAIKKDLRI